MKKQKTIILQGSLLGFTILIAEADHHKKKDIVDTAVGAGSFKTLVAAVKAAGLVDTLKGKGPFTVFAPTDEAFAKLPKGTVESLLKPENKKKLVDQCTEMLCLGEDCFDEIKHTKNYSIFKNHEEKYLGIIYDDDGIEPLKKQIKSTGKKFNVYVFSLDDSAREEEFEDVIDMVDLKPIPEVIRNVFRRIFK